MTINHYLPKNWFSHPETILMITYAHTLLFLTMFGYFNISPPDFWNWGPPFVVFENVVTSQVTFYVLLVFTTTHQFLDTWVEETLDPYITYVRDPAERCTPNEKIRVASILTSYSFYRQINVILLVNLAIAQISFFVLFLVVTALATLLRTLVHVKDKSVCTSYENGTFIDTKKFDGSLAL